MVPIETTRPRQGLYAFLFGKELRTERHDAPMVFPSTNFPVLGIAVLRSASGSMMTFDYGPFLGHGQYDKLGITFFANNKLWCADYGYSGLWLRDPAVVPIYVGT